MADCEIDKIVDGLDPSCLAVKSQGGIKKRVWIGNLEDISFTYEDDDPAGYVDAISLAGSPAAKLYKFIGREFKHNMAYTGVIGENLNTINPALNLLLYYFYPEERAAIEALYQAEDLVVFIERVGGEGKACIEIIGLLNGLKASALAGGTGTVLNDSTAITITLSGEETTLAKVLKSGSLAPDENGYLAENIDYLDALSE